MSKSGKLTLAMYAAAMGMEMSCLYAGLDLLRRHGGLGVPLILLILAQYPVSLGFRLSSSTRPRIAGSSRLWSASFGIAALTVVMITGIRSVLSSRYPSGESGEFFVLGLLLGFCVLSWWLGYSLVQDRVGYQDICLRFQIGFLALMLLAVVYGRVAAFPLVLFIALAVPALALARWEGSVSGCAGVLKSFQIRPLIMGGAALFLPGVIIFLVLSPDVARAFLGWLVAIGSFIGHLFEPRPPSATGKPLEFEFLRGCSLGSEKMSIPTSSPPASVGPGQTSALIPWIVIIALFIAALFLVLHVVKKIAALRRGEGSEAEGVEISSIPGSFLKELKFFVKKVLLKLLRFLKFILNPRHPARLPREGEAESLLSVRALYRNLLIWAASQGLPRDSAQTPLEYLIRLCRAFPKKTGELAAVTEAYVRARYGRSDALSSEQFEAAREAWRKIKIPDSL